MCILCISNLQALLDNDLCVCYKYSLQSLLLTQIKSVCILLYSGQEICIVSPFPTDIRKSYPMP